MSAPSQEVVIDDAEIRAARWVSADEALALHAAGEIELAPPTVVTLHQLRRFLDTGAATADELVAAIDADPVVEHFTTALLPGHDPLVVAWHGDVALSQGDTVHSAEPDSVLGPRHRLTMSPGGFAYERDDATHATRFGRSALDLPPPDALIRLPSGRRLAVDLRGPVGGVPVLVVHGTPDSRLARHPDDSLAEAAGVRMIIPDRPGCGDSDPDPDSTPDSVADDMVALLDVLAVERCGVLAWSAGALFAVPLAVRHPDRIGSLVLAAPLSPVTSWSAPEVEEQLTAERRAFGETVADVLVAEGEDGLPGLCAELVPFLVPDPLDAETALALALGDDEYRAAEVSAVPGAATQLASALAAAVHQGPTGVARDLLAQTLPVDPSGVRCPSAVISGDQDTACPLPMGRWWADVIPGASFEIRAGGGHCFPLSDWEDLLRRAAGLGPEQPTDD